MCNSLAYPAMNLTHTAAHRGFGVSGPNPLCMPSGSYTSPGLHQRSPFAIQELLGLGQPQDTSRTSISSHPSEAPVISASTYIPRTLGAPVGPHTHQGTMSCLSDPAGTPSAHTFSHWRPNFMAFSGGHAQNMLNLGAPHNPMSQTHTDHSTGKSIFSIFDKQQKANFLKVDT